MTTGRIARLSMGAVQMAARGGPSDAAALAQWLYRFGSMPRTPALERDFGPDDEPLGALGLAAGGAVRRRLEAAYEAHAVQGWYAFSRASQPLQLEAACKLYVSPRPAALPDALAPIVDAFVQVGVRSFKIGRGLEGLLRPDKLMAYFDDPRQMAEVVTLLEQRLAGCPVQGVPFTAELGGDGLVSAGVDPSSAHGATSWRAWITRRMAESLAAHPGAAPHARVDATLADLAAAGVDTARWRLVPPAPDRPNEPPRPRRSALRRRTPRPFSRPKGHA